MLKMISPTYVQTMLTALALGSIAGGEAANEENIIHASTMMEPSQQTPA